MDSKEQNPMLKDIGSDKTRMIKAFLDNKDLMECLLGENYTEAQFGNVVYDQIFPYLYVTETQTATKSYVCFETDPERESNTIQTSPIEIWVYCHKDIMKCEKEGYLGTRADILADMVERSVRDLDLGIGKLNFVKAPHFFPSSQYYGRRMFFKVSDFKYKKK